jgi:serine/threonine protein kinase
LQLCFYSINAAGDVKVTDFGILTQLSENEETLACQTFIGTVLYMSPERIAGMFVFYVL